MAMELCRTEYNHNYRKVKGSKLWFATDYDQHGQSEVTQDKLQEILILTTYSAIT